ncbi:MAG: precorrin-6y C5,15-methyltransferase (decarboxylating) subunit CbiE [Alphaproteobacteria bacterium]|nr:precorrin-6y C5,15-methyltransferase (decarboxylating) subunit CbiE [Alphaproteobacteria bacterium]
MTPWLSIVGLGEDGLAGLAPAARALIDAAETLVGGERHLALVPSTSERLSWKTPLSLTIDDIAARRGRRVCVLASGDPMWFGVGVTLARRFAREEMTIVPHLSAFTLAAARLGWPTGDSACLTVHGRSIDQLAPHLAPAARLIVLSEDGDTPRQVAAWLTSRGWGDSRIVVLSRMGGPQESRVEGVARDWNAPPADDLNTLAIACVADPGARPLSAIPGLPDEAFAHDGQLTKREVRAATLAALAPLPGQLLWDVGAGCGSIGVEWMRAAPRTAAIAIERHAARLDLIARNASALGVPKLKPVAGEAPAALHDLPAPDAVFIGGGITSAGLVETCWSALKPGGRLVANVVTLEGESALAGWHAKLGGTMTRLAIARLEPIGPLHGWRPLMPVTQWSTSK